MSRCIMIIGVLSLALLAMGDALAMNSGGGYRRGGGGIHVVNQGGGNGQKGQAKEDFKRWELPAPETVSSLDFAKIESALSQLELSAEQSKKIGEAKTEVAAESARLAKTQDEKRAAYQRAACEASARVAAMEVVGVAATCKAFDAQARFNLALGNILNPEQMKEYRALIAKP
ncbi:MAG: hypothetical protein L6R28_23015 [Planctomycetes bacterium]|nr:hypothetical protein [Planctomycetota bacterium]